MRFDNQLALCLAALALLPWRLTATELFSAPIFSSTQAVAAVTCGDFDQLHPGKELACLMADGSVVELVLGPAGWTAKTIFNYRGGYQGQWPDPRVRVSLKVGDVLLAHTGEELVLSFVDQVVAVYQLPMTGWTNEIIADLSEFMAISWGVETGDCDPAHPGEEVFHIVEGVFDFSTGTVYGETGGAWKSNRVYSAEVGMGAAIGDSNPDVAGNEIIVVTEMGQTYEITPPASGGLGPWPKRMIWKDPENAGFVVKIGDVDPDQPGHELVYGTRYSDRILMSRHNGTNLHNPEILFTGLNTDPPNSMLDVAISQVFPTSPGAEILGVDASGSVYVVGRATNQWQGSVLWRDTDALYAVAVADLIPTQGEEVVVAGASGVVTLLLDPTPVLNLAVAAEAGASLSWNGIAGLTYSIETRTNLLSGAPWQQETNLVYQGGFSGVLSYTNTPAAATTAQFFRVRASW